MPQRLSAQYRGLQSRFLLVLESEAKVKQPARAVTSTGEAGLVLKRQKVKGSQTSVKNLVLKIMCIYLGPRQYVNVSAGAHRGWKGTFTVPGVEDSCGPPSVVLGEQTATILNCCISSLASSWGLGFF